MFAKLVSATALTCSLLALSASSALAVPPPPPQPQPPTINVPSTCARTTGLSSGDLTRLKSALTSAVAQGKTKNGGFGFNMWATLVAQDGSVCAVVFSGTSALTDQWLHSRVISAQKAATANGLSLAAVTGASTNGQTALSTANLYSAVQPGGSLFGLQHSNPVAPDYAYGDTIGTGGVLAGPISTPASTYGTANDPMVGRIIGGVNVFGGGLALFGPTGRVGGIGVSGDTSCTDHMVAWRVRHTLNLDNFSAKGVGGVNGAPGYPDNIIYDISAPPVPGNIQGNVGVSVGGWGHPQCVNTITEVNNPNYLPAVQ